MTLLCLLAGLLKTVDSFCFGLFFALLWVQELFKIIHLNLDVQNIDTITSLTRLLWHRTKAARKTFK